MQELIAGAVTAVRLVGPRVLSGHRPLAARGFPEEVEHPIVGHQATMGAPFQYASVDQWLERAAPVLGHQDTEILRQLNHDEGETDASRLRK